MQTEITKKLSSLCKQQLEEDKIKITRLLRGQDINPFPVGKTSIENLYYGREISLNQQLILANYFGYKFKLVKK